MKHIFRIELIELGKNKAEVRVLIQGDPHALGQGIASALSKKNTNEALEELMEAAVTHHLAGITGKSRVTSEDIRLRTERTTPN